MRRDIDSGWHLTRPMEYSEYGQMNEPEPSRSIGDLIREVIGLTDKQVQEIVAYQRSNGTRFGEAAIALKLATREDVLKALARQFQYAYTPTSVDPNVRQELVVATNPFGEGAEAFRELRSQLLMGVLSQNPREPRRALAVISPDVGDGKTYIAANLAVSLSQLGGRTLLLDADMRTPRIHQICDVPSTVGLSGILSGRAERNVVQQMKDLPGLFVLPVGGTPPNPLELVQRPVFGLLLHEMLKKFDHVVVDTPAAIHGADASVIAAKAGAALIVGRKGSSRLDSMQHLARKLAKGPATIAGVVLNETH